MASLKDYPPDERAFRQHLAAGPYLAGEAAGRWRLRKISWPAVVITVHASDGCDFGFRFVCEDYPTSPPTARVWDIDTDQPAPVENWPKGGPRIQAVFRSDWESGKALYLPTDAVGIKSHPDWKTRYPSMIWRPDRGIVHYLEILHELLNSIGYGAPAAA